MFFPFWTVAFVPSICKRYSPAFSSDLPTFAFWETMILLAKGLANAGTVKARAASKAILRKNNLVFMRVNFLSVRIESAAQQAAAGEMELTRALRASTLARKTPLLPGLTAGKTACHIPAAATAGFFLNLTQNSRVTDCICLDECRRTNVSS